MLFDHFSGAACPDFKSLIMQIISLKFGSRKIFSGWFFKKKVSDEMRNTTCIITYVPTLEIYFDITIIII